jgi:hypothetical protein
MRQRDSKARQGKTVKLKHKKEHHAVSTVNDGGANSLITLASTGRMDLAAAAAAATSAEEAPRVQQTRKAPNKCKVNGCPAQHTVMGLIYEIFSQFGRREPVRRKYLMPELAKTASRVDALDTQTVPVVGYYNPIPNRCVISNVFLREPFYSRGQHRGLGGCNTCISTLHMRSD